MQKFLETPDLFHKMSMYYRSRWFIIFDFQQLSLLAKIDQTAGYGDRKHQKS